MLSIVAYRQGVTGEELNKLRGSQSHAILAQLVRRQLVRVERPKVGGVVPVIEVPAKALHPAHRAERRGQPIRHVAEAEMARRHNNLTVVTLSGQRLGADEAGAIVTEFLSEDFEGGRHERRVGEISAVEREES